MTSATDSVDFQPLKRRPAWRVTLTAISVAIGAAALITGVLHARAGFDDEADARAPIPVAAATFVTQVTYEREISFLGLVKAGRVSDLGFEVPGTLADLPVREGTEVAAGDPLGVLDTAQLQARRDATSADLERVKAELELARIKAKRQQDLQKTGAVSEEAFDETRLRARALSAQLDSVHAQLRSIDIDLDKSTLRAPYDGVVAERLVNTGAVVTPGAPVVRLVAQGAREAHIGIAAEQTRLLVEGEQYTLRLRGETINARLRSIRPDVDPQTLTTTAVFELPAETRGLDGEPVSLVLQESVAMKGGWVPMSALLEGERGLWTVLRLEETDQGVITVREAVEVLAVQGDRVYVRGTLADRQRYVADGVHRLAPGTLIDPVEA